MADGFLNRALGNFVKDNTGGLCGVNPQHMRQVPTDGLSFAVVVGGDVDFVRFLGERLEFGHARLLLGRNHIRWLVVVLHIHTDFRLGEVANVAVRGRHGVGVAQDTFDGFGFCGGLNDHEARTHNAAMMRDEAGDVKAR